MAPVTTDAKPKTADGGKAVAGPLSAEELRKMDAYFRALNYLTVGQIYLLDNPLLKEPLKREHIKPRLLGHWGTSPGLNMLCVYLNRVIKRDDLNMIYIIDPGPRRPVDGSPRRPRRLFLSGGRGEADRAQALHSGARRRHAGDRGLALVFAGRRRGGSLRSHLDRGRQRVKGAKTH